MSGKVIIFSAPSGAGKTTLVQWLLQQDLNLQFSVSATSRPRRGTEVHGKDYYFLSPLEFRLKIIENAFLEWEEVYEDKYYGTLKDEVSRMLDDGKNVLFDVDVKGGINIKKYFGEEAMAFFIQPPSIEVLEKRLIGRATDSPEFIRERVSKATIELSFAPEFDHIIVNKDLETAQQECLQKIVAFIKP